MRELAGVLVKDLWRYAFRICGPQRSHHRNAPWIWLRNRNERLSANPSGPGVLCNWLWGTELHACKALPILGRTLMNRAFSRWPIRFAPSPQSRSGPKVSFLFAHMGMDRLPQLRQVLRSVYAQRGIQVECIVADLSVNSLEAELPIGAKYLPIKFSHLPAGWYKAWAYNIAARHATGDILVFQDGDVCAPMDYGAELARVILQEGYEAASIQRFLFYLDEPSTHAIYWKGVVPKNLTPTCVLQNWKGGTIALAREAFLSMGGFDEGFVNWGGEDDEFFDRCSIKRHTRFGYLPFVHLYHPPQSDRRAPDNININKILPARLAISPECRVAELRSRDWGKQLQPDPVVSYGAAFVVANPNVELADASPTSGSRTTVSSVASKKN